ncbi:MAG TPA: SDR family oxidoreductase [Acidimicrobiales bacterium]|nr:SDR family oxidoreductase [Acidimicrobiales bacterium]
MELGLRGRVALVTASSRGLGFSSAKALAEEGANVVITSRDQSALERARADLPGPVHAIAADMSDQDTPRLVVEQTVERFGALHVVVANNGGPPPGRALELSDESIHHAVDANLLSAVRLVREARPHLRTAGWGRICCITSYSIKQPIPTLALSNVARTGLWAWVKTASPELFAEGITLNLACPGPHATDRMRQLGGGGPMGDPDRFGRIVAFLCSDAAAFMTGAAVNVDGGLTQGLL